MISPKEPFSDITRAGLPRATARGGIERVTTAPGKAVSAVRGVARLKGWAVTVLDPEGLDAAVLNLFNREVSSSR